MGRAGERERYLVLMSACVLAVLTYILRVGFSSVSTAMRGELGLDQGQLGYVMAAFMVAYGLFEVPWGWLGDHYGVRGPLSWIALGGSITTVAVVLIAFLPAGVEWRLAGLLLVRFAFGAFQAGTFPAISRMFADWMPTTERGLAQGLLWMSSRMGGMLAPLAMVTLYQVVDDWRVPLVLASILGLIWAAAFWLGYRDPAAPSVRARVHHTPWRAMGSSRSVWALCLMYGGLGYSGNFFLTLLPDYLATHRGLGPGAIKWLQALPFALGIAACLVGGKLSDVMIRRTGSRRWGRPIVGMTGLGIAAAAILGTMFVRDVWVLGALLCLTFMGNDLSMGPAWAAAADQGEGSAGTVSGLMNMTASFSAAVAAIVTGRLFQAGYVQVPFVLFSASYLIGLLCWTQVDVTRTLAPKSIVTERDLAAFEEQV